MNKRRARCILILYNGATIFCINILLGLDFLMVFPSLILRLMFNIVFL